jgi:hypothetical protein
MVTGENRSTRRKTSPIATLCTTNLTRTDLGSNRDFSGQISHGPQINIKIQSVPRSKHTPSGLQNSPSVFVGGT